MKFNTYEAKALLFLTSLRLMPLTFLLFIRLDLKSKEKDDEPRETVVPTNADVFAFSAS